ncbi:beta-glucan synthesis-associated [Auriculariales sp. MPI-PUGE-AT-0066]|nr:beta-glucan synthesis-associated [Auriculariales sp. MPI-PUGE-AT-0066]
MSSSHTRMESTASVDSLLPYRQGHSPSGSLSSLHEDDEKAMLRSKQLPPSPRPIPRYLRHHRNGSSQSLSIDDRSGLLARSGSPLATPPIQPSTPPAHLQAHGSRYPFGDEERPMSRASSYHDEGYDPHAPAAYNPAELNYGRDPDDALHEQDEPKRSLAQLQRRAIWNLIALLVIALALISLFVIIPLADYYGNAKRREAIVSNIRVNSTGQVPEIPTAPQRDPVDPDTPQEARTHNGYDGQNYKLVFSDEFNKDGRTFLPGEDPFWEAVDLWYGVTQDLEWYDPHQATTGDGKLRIKLEKVQDPKSNHDLELKSAMLQTWNKFCFTSGYIEVSVSLPGTQNMAGYWPAAWLMGNLARAGYPATSDGVWPYSYDSCDVGAMPNQTTADHSGPAGALNVPPPDGRKANNFELSWLPGQRLSSCTCAGEEHPGPRVNDGTGERFRGRGAPEIDVIEAERCPGRVGGCASQSAQFAPFNAQYAYDDVNGKRNHNEPGTIMNTFRGQPTQQAISALTNLSATTYNGEAGAQFSKFGMEYFPVVDDPSQSYITWMSEGTRTWTMNGNAIGADTSTEIQQRLISQEPMYIILNLGISHTFGQFKVEDMRFPVEFLIDYVRVYQREDADTNVTASCNPPEYPTLDYIKKHSEAYMNPQLVTWEGSGFKNPKMSLTDQCQTAR